MFVVHLYARTNLYSQFAKILHSTTSCRCVDVIYYRLNHSCYCSKQSYGILFCRERVRRGRSWFWFIKIVATIDTTVEEVMKQKQPQRQPTSAYL